MIKRAVVTAVKEHMYYLLYGGSSPNKELWLNWLFNYPERR